MRWAGLLGVALATLACDRSSSEQPAKLAPSATGSQSTNATASTSPPASASAEVELDKKKKADRTHRAYRCGECHEKMYDEWKDSAHARGLESHAYAAQRKASPAGSSCDRCHAPATLLDVGFETASREAVTCEVCHRMEAVEVGATASSFSLLRTHEIKFGPRCDLEDPYFHRARCSPLFTRSEMCASCHLLYHTPPGGTALPVHTEYEDWKKSRYAAKGKACQSCHMPGVRAALASGEPERDGVPDHGFMGDAGKLRGSALAATAKLSWEKDRTTVSVSVTNSRAGHAIPAGAPSHEVVVRAVALDAAGTEIARAERAFSRVLEDASGRAAPFFEAVRQRSDTRIQPGATRTEELPLETSAVHTLRLSLVARPLSPELAQRLGAKVEETTIVTQDVATPPSGRGRRSVVLSR